MRNRRVAPFGAVVGWPTPILGEEERESPARRRQIGGLGVQAEQRGVGGDTLVEPVDQRLEEGHATDGVVQRSLLVAHA